jgi:heme oxygenase
VTATAVAALRRATTVHHRELEDRLGLLGGPLDDLGSYRRLLERFRGFYAPVEERLDAWHAAEPGVVDWPARRKRHLLDADLAFVGGDPSPPRCTRLPDVATTPAALGALYVLEGATLGGQVIRARVGRTLGLDGDGCRFFTSYGPEVPQRWQALRRRIDAETDVAPMAASAVATFAALRDWLT